MYLIDLGVPKIGFLFFFLGGIWRGCLALTFICIQSVIFSCTHQLIWLFRSVTFPQRSDHVTDQPSVSDRLPIFIFIFLSIYVLAVVILHLKFLERIYTLHLNSVKLHV